MKLSYSEFKQLIVLIMMGKLTVEVQWAEVILFLLEKLSNSRIQIFLQKRKQLDIANSMYRLLM